jgi:hypothetical protein
MTAFIVIVYLWFGIGFLSVTRGIYRFERKNDERSATFLLKTCPHRVKFTLGTALFIFLAGYFGAMALIPVLVVNYACGWIQRAFINRWIRMNRLGVPPGYRN